MPTIRFDSEINVRVEEKELVEIILQYLREKNDPSFATLDQHRLKRVSFSSSMMLNRSVTLIFDGKPER